MLPMKSLQYNKFKLYNLLICVYLMISLALPYETVLAKASNFKIPAGFETPITDSLESNNSRSDAGDLPSPNDSSVSPKEVDPNNLVIDSVEIEGNRLVETNDILNVVKTKPGEKFDRNKVMEDLKSINSLGYFDDRSLQVVPQLKNSGVLLKIRVQENAPVTQFSFDGNNVLSSEEISRIFQDQLGRPQNLSSLSSAIDKLEQVYHERGYVLARVVDVKNDPDGSVELNINEGKIKDIEISGNTKTKEFIIKNAIKLKAGSVYNEHQLAMDLRNLYGNGYFQDVRRSIIPDPQDPDKYLLKVEVEEKRTTTVGLGGGLDSLAGPFGSVTLADSNFRGRGQTLSINGQVGMGMLGGVANSLNNLGTAYLANQRTFQLQADFVEPHLFGSNTSMTTSGYGRNYFSYLISQAQQQTIGASVNFSRSLGHNLFGNLGVAAENTMLFNESNLFTGTSNINTSIADRALAIGQAQNMQQANAIANQVRSAQLKGGTFFNVSPSISYDTRDSAFDPTKGMVAKLSTSPYLGIGNGSYARLGASFTKYQAVNKRITIASNIQGGSMLGASPQYAQYFLGGFNGIRGYPMFSGLGTGSSMLMATVEARAHLLPKSSNKLVQAIDKRVQGVAFCDFGQSMGNSYYNNLLSRSSMGASVGVELRLNLPMIGLIRLDYGFPLISSIMSGMKPVFTVGFGERFY